MASKKVNCTLVGRDSNIFNLVGAFSAQAKRDSWTRAEIEAVQKQVSASNSYDQAVSILMDNCVNGGFGPDDEDDED